MLKKIFFIVFLFGQFNPVKSQSLVFAQLTGSPVLSTSGWNLTGAAYSGDTGGDVNGSNDELILTDNIASSSGGIFYSQPIDLGTCYQWNVEFDFRIFDGNGADGIAFCFLDVPPAGFVSGGGVGIPGTANGIKVIFDTYDNGCGSNPEIQIYNGSGYTECASGIVRVNNSGGNLNFIRSNGYNHAVINYNNGTVSVSVNGTPYLSATYSASMIGYMGFTASTGGSNDRHSIKNAIIYADIATSDAGSDITICNGVTGQIGVVSNSSYIYQWTPATGLNQTTVSNPMVNLSNTGSAPILQTYTVQTNLASNPTSCPSFDSVVITILPTSSTSLNESICQGGTYNFGGQQLSAAGNYSQTLQNIFGCDSIIYLTLTVNPIISSQISQSICQGGSYNFNGQILSSAGVYTDTLQTASGCDSVVNLTLSILPPITNSINHSICQGEVFFYNGQTLTTAGNYPFNFQTSEGCDSIVTVNLTVFPVPSLPIIASNSPLLCDGDLLSISTENLNGATYNWNGPGSFHSEETNFSFSAHIENTGIYTLNVTQNGCVSPTAVTQVEILNYFTFDDFDFPNVITPNSDGINDELDIEAHFHTCLKYSLYIYNRWGNLVYMQPYGGIPFSGKTDDDILLNDGVYTYRLVYENGEKLGFIHVIK